jgi:hypothetical protein
MERADTTLPSISKEKYDVTTAFDWLVSKDWSDGKGYLFPVAVDELGKERHQEISRLVLMDKDTKPLLSILRKIGPAALRLTLHSQFQKHLGPCNSIAVCFNRQ